MIGYLKCLLNKLLIWRKYHKELIFFFSCDISRHSFFEGANKIYPYTSFEGKLGYGSYIGPHCEIKANVGRFSSISPYVRTNRGVHPVSEPFATTCPMFFSTRKQNGKSENDCEVFTREVGRGVSSRLALDAGRRLVCSGTD